MPRHEDKYNMLTKLKLYTPNPEVIVLRPGQVIEAIY